MPLYPERTPAAILVEVCRRDLAGQTADVNEALHPDEWVALWECSLEHGIAGIVYRYLSAAVEVASGPVQELRAGAQALAARSCLFASELTEILSALNHASIEALPLKGPVLSAWLYGSVACRDYYDLDILVRPSDLRNAHAVLGNRGYEAQPTPDFSRQLKKNDLLYVREADQVRVELHWALHAASERTPLENSGCWDRAQAIDVWGQRVKTLCLEDTLLYLCCHGAKHNWWKLKWLADVGWLLRRGGDIDWESVIARAREVGCLRRLGVGTGLAQSLLGARLPDALNELRESDGTAVRVVSELAGHLMSDVPVSGLRSSILRLRSYDRRADTVALALQMIDRSLRLSRADAVPADANALSRVYAALKRPVRLYRTHGLRWLAPLPASSGHSSAGRRSIAENGGPAEHRSAAK